MRARQNSPRRGATLVEAALVLSVFAMLLFGVFEYCRFLLVLHVANNATREGARYAAVNLDKPTNFDTTDFTDVGGKTYPSIQRYTRSRLAGVDNQITGFQIAVFAVDNPSLAQTPPKLVPKSLNPPTTPDPFNPSDPNRVNWNQVAFTERLAVTVRGTYTPITPILLFLPQSIPISITAMAGSEG